MGSMEYEKGIGQNFTQDGTTDLKGRPVSRSRTGRWRACYFMLGYEVCERMAYFGIATNLVLYLTRELHEGTVKSSNNVTNWAGTVWLTPLLGAYIADTYLGRYWTFMVASVIYLMGMCLLTLVVSLPSLKPPSCGQHVSYQDCDKRASSFQVGIFYCALYIIAIGTGGTKPNISTMGADQFDDFEPKERAHKLSFFNWWMFSIFFGTLFSNTFLVYIQDYVGWGLGYGIPTISLLVAVIAFVFGTPIYRHKPKAESPYTRMVKVLVATIRKRNAIVPLDPKELYELSLDEYSSPGKNRIDHSSSLRYLDKAAVRVEEPASEWKLCPVTQVEQTKQMIKMVPILCATLIPGTLFAQTQTLFIKQGTTLNRSMGPHFDIPPASLSVFLTLSMLISIALYDRFFVPFIRKYTKNPRGITLLQRMAIGLILHIITMGIASLVERRRLSVAKDHGIVKKEQIVPLTIFILLPQFVLMGVADCFLEVAKLEFFYDQAPEGMKSLGTAYFTTTLGVGYFLSSFILSTVANVTKKNGHEGWILNNLNLSHLDYYYAFYTVLSFVNFIFFLIVAKNFDYNAEANEIEQELEQNIGKATELGYVAAT
ncbi:proton-dependent oligopeptide transporter family [Artemisia annua]|uniref:Proton-dependent oligopeptide transporter family n=1 Tax=Artemisia annua TaxID=35608 RepID=A0A2U1NQ78_ARTAN|nr:proton-dependent oligopeptide transporter family [Artemisia annua]